MGCAVDLFVMRGGYNERVGTERDGVEMEGVMDCCFVVRRGGGWGLATADEGSKT